MMPSRKVLRRMSYLRDQEGIINRYLREKKSWEGHLQKSRSFIETSFQDLNVSTVAVLGSGWLLDVPMDHLCSRFDRIILADVSHPRQIQHKYEGTKGVDFVECDLSGGAIEEVWHKCKQAPGKSLEKWIMEDIKLETPAELDKAEAFISVNLLNQLDILLVEFMEGRFTIEEEQIIAFRKRLQTFHLAWTGQKPGCLITDVREKSRDQKGRESKKDSLYTLLPEGFRQDDWSWNFDNSGSYRQGQQITMEVRAVEWA